jgi:hypothetical protein
VIAQPGERGAFFRHTCRGFAETALLKSFIKQFDQSEKYEFPSFAEAMAFIIQAAVATEIMRHLLQWSNVCDQMMIGLATRNSGAPVWGTLKWPD